MARRFLAADSLISEIFLGLLATSWGLWLLNPSWNALGNSAFTLMRATLPVPVWGAFFLSSGLAQLLAWRQGNRTARRRAAMIAGTLWLFVVGSLIATNVGTTGVPVYGLVALLSGWTYLRLGYPE